MTLSHEQATAMKRVSRAVTRMNLPCDSALHMSQELGLSEIVRAMRHYPTDTEIDYICKFGTLFECAAKLRNMEAKK